MVPKREYDHARCGELNAGASGGGAFRAGLRSVSLHCRGAYAGAR